MVLFLLYYDNEFVIVFYYQEMFPEFGNFLFFRCWIVLETYYLSNKSFKLITLKCNTLECNTLECNI